MMCPSLPVSEKDYLWQGSLSQDMTNQNMPGLGSSEKLGSAGLTLASDPKHRPAGSAACVPHAGMCSQFPYPPHFTTGNGQGMLEMGFGWLFYFMHKLSACCFPHRSRKQHSTGHCHCSGCPGAPDLPSPSLLPSLLLPQAQPRKKPNLAMLGTSAFPQGATKFTPTGLGAQCHDLALPSYTRAVCTLPKPGWTWAGEGHRNEPPARQLGRGNLILHS